MRRRAARGGGEADNTFEGLRAPGAGAWPDLSVANTTERSVTYLNCPRCALSIRVGADYLASRNCPRCIARHRLPVPMYSTSHPARLAAENLLSADGAGPASQQLRRGSPELGTDTAA